MKTSFAESNAIINIINMRNIVKNAYTMELPLTGR